MSKIYIALIISLIFLLKIFVPVYAYHNNKFGIHILDENDIEDAANLVNSQGGDWGYVTIVIREDEKDQRRWQGFLDKLREKRLIPILRIASKQTNSHWEKPDLKKINDWVKFLNSLNWVIQNRYVIIGNEPNHAKEWGGQVNPKEYAEYLYQFSKALEESNQDYVVMPAGFDASAPNDAKHMDQADYIKAMIRHKPNVFDHIEAWSSHSYPNPGFSGEPTDKGRGTIVTYKWELDFLKSLGIKKDLPVFITETGWAHNMGENKNGYLSIETVNNYFEKSFSEIWNDPKILAITPFILRYDGQPFDVFSWKNKEGQYYPFFETIQKMPKVKGSPKQISKGQIIEKILPPFFENEGKKYGLGIFKNTGQSIWEKKKPTDIDVNGRTINILPANPFEDILPFEMGIVFYSEKEENVLGMQIPSIFDRIFEPIINFTREKANNN
ncbi:MAG: glycoside hydrolase family 5 protein [Patescibacteria group bacterium]|nr:glycoside hydrolase family 5 protein [Patescibacteria group bacterium]